MEVEELVRDKFLQICQEEEIKGMPSMVSKNCSCLANATLPCETALLLHADAEEGIVLRELLVRTLGHHHRQVERYFVPHDVHLNGG